MPLIKPANPRWAPTIYFVLGQAGWFACVLGAAHHVAYWGIALVIVLIALHLLQAERARAEAQLVALVVLIGGTWETLQVHWGFLAYDPDGPAGLAPLWLFALWGLFAAQINTTYRWLKSRWWAAVMLGALAGPLSFRAGAALGALRFVQPFAAFTCLAIGWAVLLPVVVGLSRRWDGVKPT
jgi:hypothetical protein